MPVHCDICGIEALESQEFAEERLPFRRAKFYCPTCHTRFYHRVYGVFGAILAVVFLLIVTSQWGRFKSFLDVPAAWVVCVFLLLYVMIVPHELGHAMAAHSMGFKKIRILLGSGKPIVSFNLFGFPAILNQFPLRGVTLFELKLPFKRWKYCLVIAAGPFVNFLFLLGAFPFVTLRGFFDGHTTWPELIVAANLVVLLQSLFPWLYRGDCGELPSDGLQLLQILFRRGRLFSQNSTRIPIPELILCYALKCLILMITAAASILFVGFAIWLLFDIAGTERLGARIFVCCILLGLSAVTGWATYRFYKDPIDRQRKPHRGIWFSPEQTALIHRGNEASANKDFIAAQKIFEQTRNIITDKNSREFSQLFLAELVCMAEQGSVEQAFQSCMSFSEENLNKESRITILDGLACHLLFSSSSAWLPHAEKLILRALELTPDQPSLKGTLGGVLTEMGRFSEAEPLLRECLERSLAIHDQAISSLYLGFIQLARGNTAEGERLVKYAMVALPETWLLAKGRMHLDKARAAKP
jgi:Flp pilus assembly protein TadD, contains TPR repeats